MKKIKIVQPICLYDEVTIRGECIYSKSFLEYNLFRINEEWIKKWILE